MTSGDIVFSSITIRRLVGGLKWNSDDYLFWIFFSKCKLLYLHASSSCHIVRDEWWPAAAAADDSTPHTLSQSHTRSVLG